MSKAFVTLASRRGDSADWFRMRFGIVAAKMLKGVSYVSIGKTQDHIILNKNPKPDERVFPVRTEIKGGYPFISVSSLVKSEGFLDESWFSGKRYAVKRNKDGTKIYICLKEVVNSIDGEGQKNQRT